MTRRLLIPAIATIVMLAVLITLGTWQLQRLAWKTDVIARLDAAERLPAVPFSDTAPPFAKVRIEGTFRPGITALYGSEGRQTRTGPAIGAHLLAVLDRPGAPPVIVDRGWVPQALRPAPPAGPVVLEGWLRPAEQPGMFSATDNPAERRFYTLDPQAIGAGLGVGPVAPFILVVLGKQEGWDQPEPATTLPRPSNNHLTYVFTWYSFAAVLLVIFALYARKQMRTP